ncbi:VOC family protein [Phytomonospora sp. NPDC050363]|uniref:VOC family protein n=1 Tax=Phytomonospora sp. NPDC050363 TaxID=3155642 RepID=UPI0033E5E62B
MPIEFANGEPAWVDLGSHDLQASKDFYHHLFDWEYQDLGAEAGQYHFILSGGKQVGGLGPIMEEGAGPAWTTYFQVADAEATAAKVAETGGTVRFPPMDVMGQNVIAGFSDPAGGQFAVTQPKAHKGAEVWRENNAVCWVEYSGTEVREALEFYHRLFGWSSRQAPEAPPGMEYLVQSVEGGNSDGLGGVMANPDHPAGAPPYWCVHFATADTDAVAAKAGDMGGTLMVPPMSIEGIGRMSVIADPQGAVFATLTPEPRAG